MRRAFTRQRTLLIIDNMETIDDERVLNFLQELPAPTKAIITSRHRLGTAVPVRLTEMPWPDAQTLMRQECAKRDISLSAPHMQRLFERTSGLPLAIIWSIAQMGIGYGIETVLARLGTPTNDVVRFCFEGAIEKLRPHPAYKLLLACAMFRHDVRRNGLGIATGLSVLDRDDGLVELERLSLLNKSADQFSLLQLTRTFALAELEKEESLDRQIRRGWIIYFVDLCEEPVDEYYWRYRSQEFHEEGDNLLETLEWAYELANIDEIMLLTRAVYDYLEVIGDWNLILTYAGRALTLVESVSVRQVDVAKMANIRGWIHYQQGDFKLARTDYEFALQNYREVDNKVGEAITYQQLGSLERKFGKFGAAKELNDKAWAIAESLADDDLKMLIKAAYGKLARDQSQSEQAWDHFAAVRDYFEHRVSESPRDEPLARSVWGHLAIVAVHLGRPAQAKEYCLRSLDYFEHRGTKGFLATLKYRLALAEMALGEYESAAKYLAEAMDLFDRLGMKPDYADAEKTRQQLAEKMKQSKA